jgi:hypothetical protein
MAARRCIQSCRHDDAPSAGSGPEEWMVADMTEPPVYFAEFCSSPMPLQTGDGFTVVFIYQIINAIVFI